MSTRSRRFLAAVLVAASGFGARAAQAQVVVSPWFWGPGVRVSPYGYGGYGGYGGLGAAGYDPITGYRMATAELIRAYGQAAEARSRAMLNYEQARSEYIENAERWTEIYNRRRRQNLALEAYERDQKRENLQQYLQRRPDPAPPRTLTPAQLNPSTGDIAWPSTLLDEDYAELRQALEQEFATLAHTSGAAGNARKIQELADMMRDVLRAHIHEMPAYEYIAARKFIENLANSAVAL